MLRHSRNSIFPIEGVVLEEDEKPRLVRDLGDKRFLMLRSHGLLMVGRSVAEAFVAMYFFETACMIQVRAMSGGQVKVISANRRTKSHGGNVKVASATHESPLPPRGGGVGGEGNGHDFHDRGCLEKS